MFLKTDTLTRSPIIFSVLPHLIVLSAQLTLKHFSRTLEAEAQYTMSFLIGNYRRPVLKGIHSGPSFLSAQLMKSITTPPFFWLN